MAEKRDAGCLKSVGGKAGQVVQLAAMLPTCDRFIDPFVGGASLPCYLRKGGFTGPMLLSDANRPLMAVWQALQQEPDALVARVDAMRKLEGRSVFEVFRGELDALYKPQIKLGARPLQMSVVEVAARWIYLNRRTFSGLSRVNRQGGLNMPWGEDAALPSEATLRRAAAAMAGATLATCSFEDVIPETRAGDFLFLDPPYLALDGKQAFTAYSGAFDVRHHRKLEQLCQEADGRGVKFLACNADCQDARAIWRDWKIETVYVGRPGNSNGGGRGAVAEIRVRNYEVKV